MNLDHEHEPEVRVSHDRGPRCATPTCRARVAYRGEFCRACYTVQQQERRRLQARRALRARTR